MKKKPVQRAIRQYWLGKTKPHQAFLAYCNNTVLNSGLNSCQLVVLRDVSTVVGTNHHSDKIATTQLKMTTTISHQQTQNHL